MKDLDICKRIAEIEGLEFYLLESGEDTYPLIKVWSDSVLVGKDIPKRFFTAHDYNVVTNDALCFQLMVKYKITTEFTRYYEHLKSTTVKAFYDDKADNGYGAFIRDINPNKAICLAIIEAHKEQS